ncbi:5103_t:CDS:2, partial [Acaulospora colombiana]
MAVLCSTTHLCTVFRSLSGKKLLGALLSFGILESVAQNGYVVPAGSREFYVYPAVDLLKQSTEAIPSPIICLTFAFIACTLFIWRIPSLSLALSSLMEGSFAKAAGLNGVSGVNRWTNHNDIAKFLEVAKEVGLLVIVSETLILFSDPHLRPYRLVQDLISMQNHLAVRLPGTRVLAYLIMVYRRWSTCLAWKCSGPSKNQCYGIQGCLASIVCVVTLLRIYYVKLPYSITEFAKLSAPYQVSSPIVLLNSDSFFSRIQAENEFGTSEYYNTPGLEEYMQDVIDTLRAVPRTHNDNWPKGAYGLPGLGQVDLYGWDGYPALFDCFHPDVWPETDTSLHANHVRLAPAVPLALYEWQ